MPLQAEGAPYISANKPAPLIARDVADLYEKITFH